MEITASLVKELRERTGSGMMECKKALVEAQGDIEAAIEAMRKSGQAKAAKKAGRIAAEGIVLAQKQDDLAAIVEINSETDFVAKGDDFKEFAQAVINTVFKARPANLEALLAADLNGKTVEETRNDLVVKIGENINVRRFTLFENVAGGNLGVYPHGTRIAVLVQMQGGTPELAKDVAMHIAASRPVCVSEDQVPAEDVARERRIFSEQAAESGKPANVIEKMVEGRVKKFLAEVTLVGQAFVKNPDQTVEQLLKANGATVLQFARIEVGEGIEKKVENFAEEVMQQVKGLA